MVKLAIACTDSDGFQHQISHRADRCSSY